MSDTPKADPREVIATEQDLEDLITDAIDDSMDMDWTGRLGAQSVLRALTASGLSIVPVATEKPDHIADAGKMVGEAEKPAREAPIDERALGIAWNAVSGMGYRHLEPLIADAIRAYLTALRTPAEETGAVWAADKGTIMVAGSGVPIAVVPETEAYRIVTLHNAALTTTTPPVAEAKVLAELQSWLMKERLDLRTNDPDFFAKHDTLKKVGNYVREALAALSALSPAQGLGWTDEDQVEVHDERS